jgi:hypothetical protein
MNGGARNKTTTGELVAYLVERSAPDTSRPRLAPEREKRLEAVEQKSAACYAQAELLALKMQRLATQIDTSREEDAASDGVPELADDPDDTSVVVHINALRAQAKIE